MDQNVAIALTQWLDILQCIALLATLGVIIWYTIETRRMANVQIEELNLKKRPVVSFIERQKEDLGGGGNIRNFYIRPSIRNFSTVPAKARIKATIKIDGRSMDLPISHDYSGGKIWYIQAMGEINGDFQMVKVMEKNNFAHPDLSSVDAEITIESWAINYYNPDAELFNNLNGNPLLIWRWDNKRHYWVPDAAPVAAQ